jgi:hypothetical protein
MKTKVRSPNLVFSVLICDAPDQVHRDGVLWVSLIGSLVQSVDPARATNAETNYPWLVWLGAPDHLRKTFVFVELKIMAHRPKVEHALDLIDSTISSCSNGYLM